MAVGPMITATSIRLRERAFDCRLAEGGYTGDGELFDQAFKMIEQQAAEIEHHQAAKRRALAIADERAIEANGVRAENERLRALLIEIRGDINNYGFSDSFADETHKTLAKIDIGLAAEQEVREKGTT